MTPLSISHYGLLKKLGAGGMGEVYLANDTKLKRKVAIKLVKSASIADTQAKKRLVREARAAAKIDHPNICSIYEIGEENDQAFIVMQYVEGQTLADRMRDKKFKLPEVLDIAAQVADALSEAHAQGIIHRDLKPQNIMITRRGQVKVLDFGLAKIAEERRWADSDAETETLLSRPGAILGTVPYLSPEQVLAKDLDSRTDIFSFGVVLYEMVTGKQPFAAESNVATISAVLHQEPPPIAHFTPDVSPDLERIVRRCLDKDRERRYQSAREAYIDLQNLRESLKSFPDGPGKHRLLRQRRWPHRAGMAALAATIVALIGAAIYLVRSSPGTGDKNIDSLAVLPFGYVSNDPNLEYIGDGITESLINDVSRLNDLRVIAHASVLNYKARDPGSEFSDALAVGRDLKVKAVLTGRLVQIGENVAVSAELADARNNSHIWGAQYKRKTSDVLAVAEEIFREVSGKLRPGLTSEDRKRLSNRYPEDTEAYRLYLKGRYYWNKRTRDGLRKAEESFQEAISKDPNCALAYAGLADCYALAFGPPLPPKDEMSRARAAALKALEIDETIAEAHTSLALVEFWYDWDWPRAEQGFKRAIELNSNYATAHQWYAEYLAVMRRPDEAAAEIRRAQEIDPLSLIISSDIGRLYYYMHQYDQAINQYRKTLQMDENFPRTHTHLGRAYEQKGMFPEAVAEYVKAETLAGVSEEDVKALKSAYATKGWTGFWKQELDEAMERSKDRYVSACDVAQMYSRLGEQANVFEWLEKAYQDRDHALVWINAEPLLDSVSSTPRFKDLIRRIGLPQ